MPTKCNVLCFRVLWGLINFPFFLPHKKEEDVILTSNKILLFLSIEFSEWLHKAEMDIISFAAPYGEEMLMLDLILHTKTCQGH